MRKKLPQDEDKLLPLTPGYSACDARTTTIDQTEDYQPIRRQAQQQNLLQMLAAVVPILEDLALSLPITSRLSGHDHMHALSSWISGLDLTDSHFAWTAHNFQFAALHTLSLDNLAIAVTDFTSFLQTAQPTLRRLSILRVHWTKRRVVDMSRAEKGEIVKAAESVCRLICKHLQDCFPLESLILETWYYQASPILVIDPDHRRARRYSARPCTTHSSLPVRYGTERTISFEAWLDQLIFIARVPRVSLMFL
ncbi:hypothetical protein BJX66DRAFT_344491 [Aspergillus keveii]|uniref:Uncharacterized protein n=1 Tax=Aspergillus keveii TaxID=714993 RepID=A0ABR4FL01_9EURO